MSFAEIRLARGKYLPGDLITGSVRVMVFHKPKQFESVRVSLEAATELNLPPSALGLFDSFSTGAEQIVWIHRTQILAQNGTLLPDVDTNVFPFEFPLAPTQSRQFMETLHGAMISTRFLVKCEVSRGLFSRTLYAECEFVMEFPPSSLVRRSELGPSPSPYRFKMSNLIVGELPRTRCALSLPITGSIQSCNDEGRPRYEYVGVDLELVRVEKVFYGHEDEEELVEEISSVRRIQIADGMLACGARPVEFALYAPPLLTCTSFAVQEFEITFQLHVLLVMENEDVLVHRIPLVFVR